MNAEAPLVSGIAHDRSQSKITLVNVPDVPGKSAAIFSKIAKAGINIDMIVQNVSASQSGKTDVSFTLSEANGPKATQILQANQEAIGFEKIIYNDQVGKLSIVGAGIRSHPGVSAKMFEALSGAGINVDMISASEIRLSVVVDIAYLDDAVSACHTAFDLDGKDEAVVYAGSGR